MMTLYYRVTNSWLAKTMSITTNNVSVIRVHKGYNLGFILLLVFMNDLPKCINKCQCYLFADDTIVYA